MARILIVDDDESIRRLVRLNLTDLYEIFDTGKPEEALALALEHKPDAILLDLRMPGYSGFELCKTFTTFSATQLIPVFVISGEGGAKTKEFCRDLGARCPMESLLLLGELTEAIHQVRRHLDSIRAVIAVLPEDERHEATAALTAAAAGSESSARVLRVRPAEGCSASHRRRQG